MLYVYWYFWRSCYWVCYFRRFGTFCGLGTMKDMVHLDDFVLELSLKLLVLLDDLSLELPLNSSGTFGSFCWKGYYYWEGGGNSVLLYYLALDF